MDKILTKVPFIDQVLKGLGQIMLQENSSTGLLFLIGIFLGSIEGGRSWRNCFDSSWDNYSNLIEIRQRRNQRRFIWI